MHARLVGREAEVAQLQGMLEAAAGGVSPMAALVVGLPGAGKTRLLAEVCNSSPLKRLQVIGYEAEQSVPLTAARDLLRQLSRAPREGRRLARAAFGQPHPGEAATPLRVFEAAYRCMAELTPLVISADDLQWTDEVSGALLTYLVRAAATDGLPIALVAAGRPASRTAALRDTLAAVLPEGGLLELELAPLPEPAGIALVQQVAPATPTDEAQRIWQRAGGSPFWLQALALGSEGLDASLSRRFGQLGEDGAALLQALAVIARPAQHGELGALLSWPTARVAAAIRELSSRGLAVEGAGGVEAAHDLVRETAQRETSRALARTLHARLARHLHAAAGDEVQRLQEALEHAIAGGERAVDIAIDVARAPQRRIIGASGVAQLARVAEDAGWSDPRRMELELALAELSSELGDRTLELERWQVVAQQSHGLARARALHQAAKAAYRLGLREAAAALIARARSEQATDRALEIALDAQESAILRWLAHRLPDARRLTTRAVAGAERALADAQRAGKSPDARIRAAAMDALHAAYDLALQEGYEQEQLAIAQRLVAVVAHGEAEEMESRLLLSAAYRRAGMMDQAELVARQVRDLAGRRLYPALMVNAAHHLARALYALGRMAEAEEVAAEAESWSQRFGEGGRFLSEIRSLRPSIALSRGDWRAGIARLEADIEREPDRHYQLGIHQEIATWLGRLGGPPAAAEVRARLNAAQACLQAVGCPRCARELALTSAEALARIGDVEAAKRMVSSPAAANARRSSEGRLFLRRALGALRQATDRSDRAAKTLRQLSLRLAASGNHREALWADMDRAEALAQLDRRAAVEVYRSVVERAAAGGVLTDLQVAQQRLRALGGRVAPPRQNAGPLGLSRRELEVARMAASGASNPEIAASLFLSRKTVERHVSSALAKTGARNRAHLASRLSEIGVAPKD